MEDEWSKKNKKKWDKGEFESYLKRREKALDTQGRRKMWNYFFEISQSTEFLKEVEKVRKSIEKPEREYYLKDDKDGNIEIFFKKIRKKVTSKEIKKIVEQIKKDKKLSRNNLRKGIYKICKKYYLHPLYWGPLIEDIIIKDKIPKMFDDFGFDLCLFLDQKEENEQYKLNKLEGEESDTLELDDQFFPLAIRISPYASKRDILNFVNKTYNSDIKFAQNHYLDEKIKIGKIKQRNSKIQNRNDFIYKNRTLPQKEIMKLVNKKFPNKKIYDYSYIGKIIYLEKKRRKEV